MTFKGCRQPSSACSVEKCFKIENPHFKALLFPLKRLSGLISGAQRVQEMDNIQHLVSPGRNAGRCARRLWNDRDCLYLGMYEASKVPEGVSYPSPGSGPYRSVPSSGLCVSRGPWRRGQKRRGPGGMGWPEPFPISRRCRAVCP